MYIRAARHNASAENRSLLSVWAMPYNIGRDDKFRRMPCASDHLSRSHCAKFSCRTTNRTPDAECRVHVKARALAHNATWVTVCGYLRPSSASLSTQCGVSYSVRLLASVAHYAARCDFCMELDGNLVRRLKFVCCAGICGETAELVAVQIADYLAWCARKPCAHYAIFRQPLSAN